MGCMVYGNQVRIVSYVSPSEAERLRELAKREDRKVAALVRLAIRDLIDREVPEDA